MNTETSSGSAGEAGVVTGIDDHPRRRGRYVLRVDGIERGTLAAEFIGQLGLRIGAAIPAVHRRPLERALRRTALLDSALDLLAARALSSADLRTRLRRRSADARDIAWVLERLTRLGYLDDAAFARDLARARVLGGGVSRRRLQEELYRRGIARETGAEALDAVLAETQLDERGAALNAARKRARALASLEPAARRRRLYAWLARRGYEADVISSVLRDVLRAEELDEAPGGTDDGAADTPDVPEDRLEESP